MYWLIRPDGLSIGGHRGAPDVAPENTIAAVAAAHAAGVGHVEIDVRRTADGALVVFHDATLERTTDGHGVLEGATLAELRELDAGSWFHASFAGERIPTLEELLAWLERHPPFGAMIDVKVVGGGAEVARRIARSPSHEYLAVCSAMPDELVGAKAAEPTVPAILLVPSWQPADYPIRQTLALGVDGFDYDWPLLSVDLVAEAHGRGLMVTSGLVHDSRGVEQAIRLGLDFADSDRPALALAALQAARARAVAAP